MNDTLIAADPHDKTLTGSFLLSVKMPASTIFTTISRESPRTASTDMLDILIDKKPDMVSDPAQITLHRIPAYSELNPLQAIVAALIGNGLQGIMPRETPAPVDHNIPVVRCHKYVGRFGDNQDAVLIYQTAYASGISIFSAINPIDGRAYALTADQNMQTFRGVMLPEPASNRTRQP